MLRNLLRSFFGRPEQPATSSQREPSDASLEAPARTSSADVGDVTAATTISVHHGFVPVAGDAQPEMDHEAVAEYNRMNEANRTFVEETRPLERSDSLEAVARYHRAVAALIECRDFARAKGLEAHGFTLNETDAAVIERLTTCLVKMRLVDEAAAELDRFVEAFPLAKEMTIVKTARNRISSRARGAEE